MDYSVSTVTYLWLTAFFIGGGLGHTNLPRPWFSQRLNKTDVRCSEHGYSAGLT